MKQRKVPMRTCIVTKEKCEKKDLIRVVRTPEGNFEVDLTGKKNGRGAYLKKEALVFAEAKKRKILNRVFETEVDDKIFDDLNDLLK